MLKIPLQKCKKCKIQNELNKTYLENRWSQPGFTKPVKPVRPGSGLGRYQTGPNSKFKFESKNEKFLKKISKNTSRCDESNGVKFSQKFVYLV